MGVISSHRVWLRDSEGATVPGTKVPVNSGLVSGKVTVKGS